jgi:hypothetical protein
MWTHVIVEDLHPIQNRAVLSLERTHHTLSVPDLTVHALHPVIVVLTCERDSNVKRAVYVPVGSVFLEPCVVILS